MDLSNQPAYSVPKPNFKRGKPTAKQRGDISTKVRRQLRDRSCGVCEKCRNNLATDAAHLIRRWKVPERTTVDYLAHLCPSCHRHCDETREGREWLSNFRKKLLEESA